MQTMPDNPVVVPSWFVRIFGVGLALAIPWAIWITMTLATMSVKMDQAAVGMQKREELSDRFHMHTSDPTIHRSGLLQVDAKILEINRRLTALENHQRDKP